MNFDSSDLNRLREGAGEYGAGGFQSGLQARMRQVNQSGDYEAGLAQLFKELMSMGYAPNHATRLLEEAANMQRGSLGMGGSVGMGLKPMPGGSHYNLFPGSDQFSDSAQSIFKGTAAAGPPDGLRPSRIQAMSAPEAAQGQMSAPSLQAMMQYLAGMGDTDEINREKPSWDTFNTQMITDMVDADPSLGVRHGIRRNF